MKSTNNKVLVTGAEGFIGSHLVQMLIERGYAVRAFVLYNSFNSWGWLETLNKEQKSNIEIFSGDIRDPNGVRSALIGCDAVLHLAALIAIPYSYHSPQTYVDTNISGTLNILQAARDLGIKRIIHTSTSEVYGSAQFVPISESHPLVGQSPYSASKIGADQLVAAFYNSFNLPVVTVRPFNTYGPRQSARAVIPTIITQIANQNYKIKLGALSPTRDFSFVTDTASAFVSVLESDLGIGEVFNFGSGFEISVGDTATTIAKLMDASIEIETKENRLRPKNSEVDRLFADASKAMATFDWQPQYTLLDGFKRGLKTTIEWFLDEQNLTTYKSDIYNV